MRFSYINTYIRFKFDGYIVNTNMLPSDSTHNIVIAE